MGITTGILIFDDAEELDFVGPWEVFTMARLIAPDDRVVTIAATREPDPLRQGPARHPRPQLRRRAAARRRAGARAAWARAARSTIPC